MKHAMEQMSQVDKPATVSASPARERAPAEPVAVSDADLEMVSGGGGASGGVLGDRR